LRHLALCNTCIPSSPEDERRRRASNPYEDSTDEIRIEPKPNPKPNLNVMDRKEDASSSSAAGAGAGSGEEIKYASSSPDELALVEAAKRLGVVLAHRERSQVTLHVNSGSGRSPSTSGREAQRPRSEVYTILHTLEFSSDRKRMSVIVQSTDPKTGEPVYTLWCKGADDKILERLTPGNGTWCPDLDRC
jgi:hypothetical protein